jgi:hypothetical protein
MTKALSAVLVMSVVFAFFFTIGGAGIYGSPFAGPPRNWGDAERRIQHEKNLMLLTILAGPAACLAALPVHRRYPYVAGAVIIAGVISGAYLGMLTRFRAVWELVFLLFVWLPMLLVGLILLASNPTRDERRGATVYLRRGHLDRFPPHRSRAWRLNTLTIPTGPVCRW